MMGLDDSPHIKNGIYPAFTFIEHPVDFIPPEATLTAESLSKSLATSELEFPSIRKPGDWSFVCHFLKSFFADVRVTTGFCILVHRLYYVHAKQSSHEKLVEAVDDALSQEYQPTNQSDQRQRYGTFEDCFFSIYYAIKSNPNLKKRIIFCGCLVHAGGVKFKVHERGLFRRLPKL